MPSWKKILQSGSAVHVLNITASSLPSSSQPNIIGYDTASGRFTFFPTSSIAGGTSGTGTQNYIPRWTSDTTLSTSSLREINGSITIGTPGDSGDTVYTDGLFTDFTADGTTIATAVDRFNEVLKGLAPPPAPTLDNIEVITGQGTNSLRLSFGGTVTTESYTNCDGTGSLSAIGFSSSFVRILGSTQNGTSYIRLGTYTSSFNLNVLLNDDVVPNGSPFVNYNSRSFDVPTTGGEAYVLEINGNRFTESTSGTNALAGTYFNLTAVRTGSFPTNGQSFNIFSHRTGSVTVTSVLWRNGWNHAKVFQTESGGDVRGTTTYIDWIYDPAAASGTFPIIFTTPFTSSVTNTGVKWLSGVPYLTQSRYTFNTTASNYYKNVYSTANIAATNGLPTANGFSALTKVGATVVSPIPDPEVATGADTLFRISSVHNVSNNTRLLSESVQSTIHLNNSLGKNANATLITARYLYDAVNTTNDVNISPGVGVTARENFCLEDFRIPSASYPDSSSLAAATWTSTTGLGNGELLVYSGSVMYPTRALNSGNFNTANIFYTAPGTLPNYSNLTGDRFYFRRFRNNSTTSPIASFTLQLSGSADGSVVTHAGSLSATAIKVGIKIPGETGYRDPAVGAPVTYTSFSDGVGCAQGTVLSHTTGSVVVTFQAERIRANSGPNTNSGFIVRLHASSNWTGNIRGITIINPS